ncbi:hypothetical protein GZH46_02708, partial [Fragariocoptes setiger]
MPKMLYQAQQSTNACNAGVTNEQLIMGQQVINKNNKPELRIVGSVTLLIAIGALAFSLMISSSYALSLISEKCDPSKVGPDETTVKGGWQAEMFNGLSFRACDKSCMPEANSQAIIACFKQHSPRAHQFYQQCTQNATLTCQESNKQEIHFCLASVSQAFVQQEKCGQILNEATIKCLAPYLTDQIELCFIKENVQRANGGATATSSATVTHHMGAGTGNSSTPVSHLEVIVQSPKPARAFLKQFEYANYDALRHACDPELEFDQQITTQEMTEIQAFYTIASTLCRDECLPQASKKAMKDCLVKNSPMGAKVYNQCVSMFGPVCSVQNEENLTSCFNTAAQNLTMNDKCVELVSDNTQKCWSSLIKNETTYCVERKNLQTVSFEYGKVCNSNQFSKRSREEQTQIVMAHKTNQENLLRRALEIMCCGYICLKFKIPNCVNNDQRTKMIKCLEKDSPYAMQIYDTCSKQSKIKCDMEENIESYAEYVNCIYTEADTLARAPNRTSSC